MLTPQNSILIPGPAGQLEILPVDAQSKTLVVICHPHSLQGGTMNNKVVTTMARACSDLQLNTIRFNFRGVGKSTGEYDDGRGELADLFTVVYWAKKNFPFETLWLAGFSFGAWIATKGALELAPQKLITIAPMFSRLKHEKVNELKCPWILVQGEQDELVHVENLFLWLEGLTVKPSVIRMPETGHFFHGKLGLLRELLAEVMADQK
ncbi:MAG: alpha/beta hydrolase [Gammaproteobacteria bacterium]|nr:alpha/beta hydrolase [Gammaproteobacteria bacterium]